MISLITIESYKFSLAQHHDVFLVFSSWMDGVQRVLHAYTWLSYSLSIWKYEMVVIKW